MRTGHGASRNTVSVTDPVDNKLLGVIRLGDPQPGNLSPLYKGQVLVHGMGFSPDHKTLAVVSIGTNSVAFIDTAPAVESPALAAVRAADFCLIVSRPGILDLRSIGTNVEIAKLAGKPVALVINAGHVHGGRAVAAGEDAGRRYGVEVCPIIIRQRAIFSHALVESRCAQEVEPAGKAAAEVVALWGWIARRAVRESRRKAPETADAMVRLSA